MSAPKRTLACLSLLLSRDDTRQLAQAVHVLAEEVAAVPAAVAGGG